MNLRKTLALTAMLALTITGISGCSQSASATDVKHDDSGKRMKIVCTIFPEYDWVKTIMGDKAKNADITYLLGSGIDMHNFQPTADDIIKISDCDLFIYAGGESDEWAKEAAENARNKDMKVIDLLETVGDRAKAEEIKEGMQAEDHDHDHDEDHDHDHDEEEEEEYDEHVWLSLQNAKLICSRLTDALCEKDAANADTYRANLTAYTAELDALDADLKALFESAPVKTLVFGDRFPFRYFVDDYGLDYYAAFVGCSAETEASFETVIFLAEKMNELGAKTIYTIENSDKTLAQTIINSTEKKDQTIAELNSLQSISSAQADGGASYLSLMRENYNVLKETLK